MSCGVPVTVTGSPKTTLTATVSPALYDPLVVLAVTLETVGATVSTTRFLLAPREVAAPGEARVRSAAFPAVSAIVPPFRASDVVAT